MQISSLFKIEVRYGTTSETNGTASYVTSQISKNWTQQVIAKGLSPELGQRAVVEMAL